MTDDDEIITFDEPEPTKDEVIARAQALLGELDQLRDKYARLTPDEKAQLPDGVRRFIDPDGG